MFKSWSIASHPTHTCHLAPPPHQGEGEMSTATPPGHPTWAGVVKGKPPPSVPTGPSPPAVHLLQLYRDCVARETWARLCFETKGGEEELSFSCRVGGAATGASKKQGRPANERRKERARRRRRAWEERRRRPAAEGAAAATAAPGATSQTGEAVTSGSSSHRNSGHQQLQQLSTGEVAIGRSNSCRQEQQLLPGAAAGTGTLYLFPTALDRSSICGRSSRCKQY